MLVKLCSDVKEMKQQVEHSTVMLQSPLQNGSNDYDFELPDGLEWPKLTDDHMSTMEKALDDGKFRRRLVRISCCCTVISHNIFLTCLYDYISRKNHCVYQYNWHYFSL